MTAGEPVQGIASIEDSSVRLVNHDVSKHPDTQAEVLRLVELEISTPFNLATDPMIRGLLIKTADNEHLLFLSVHHIAYDGWSSGILIKELNKLYAAFHYGLDDPLPPLEIQYADYAVWQRKQVEDERSKQQEDFWRNALAGAPALLELPTDNPRPNLRSYAGAFEPFELDEELTASLKSFCRTHRVTLFMVLMSAWAALLARLSGQQDVLIGTPSANRGQRAMEDLIGFFANTLVIRLDLSGSPTVAQVLEQTKAASLAALQNQDVPFERVVEIARPVRSISYAPLVQVMFAWQNITAEKPELPELEAEFVHVKRKTSKFDLLLELRENEKVIDGGIEYAAFLFKPSTIKRYAGYLRSLRRAMLAGGDQPIDQLPINPESERHQILVEWNRNSEFPDDKCIHELFEEQVDRTPNATALSFGNTRVSYTELNRRANRLAHYLRGLGVRPDTHVAICAQRSIEMVVALLAVLKAGAAYVPLDPAYPVERLNFMLDDSSPIALLVHDELRGLFSSAGKEISFISLNEPHLWSSFPETNPERWSIGLNSHHLAYVIYTSGSTGNPKGCLIEHAQVSQLFVACDSWFHFDHRDVWTLFHSYGFDFSVWELWGSLFYGGRLVIVPKDVAQSASEFCKLICREKVTILNQTPTAFRQLISAQGTSKEVGDPTGALNILGVMTFR